MQGWTSLLVAVVKEKVKGLKIHRPRFSDLSSATKSPFPNA
jgi:hypothetical protein